MEPKLKHYTVAEIRGWLINNQPVDGLSEHIIDSPRVWAIINNPFVKDNDPVLAVIFIDKDVAAYVSALPELINGERQWWFSALWCNPEYRGQGFGLVVIGSLAEVYGIENCYDKWVAEDTIEIFSYLGHKTSYTKRYIFGCKINKDSIKGKISHFIRMSQRFIHRFFEANLHKDYAIKYLSCIDDATYQFISNNQKDNYFIHSQEMLNWVLHCSFTSSAPLHSRIDIANAFSSYESTDNQMYAVQVLSGDQLVGVYIMKQKGNCLHVFYLYYVDTASEIVFASIKDHIRQMNISQFATEDAQLAAYLRENVYFPKYNEIEVSFSHPSVIKMPENYSLQYGDGDNYTI